MILQIVITLIIIIIVSVLYTYWLKPKKQLKSYIKQIRNLGYSVLQCPYRPFQDDFIIQLTKGETEGDALKTYKSRGKYDVVVTNLLKSPKLQLNHPDFIKAFYQVDKHYQYPKQQTVINNLRRILGNGLALAEGKDWRKKRTILNTLFNFNFFKSQSNKIAYLCDKSFNKLQKQANKIQIQGKNGLQYFVLDFAMDTFSNVVMESVLGGTSQQNIDGKPIRTFLIDLFQDTFYQTLNPINIILGEKILNFGFTKSHRELNQRRQKYRKWGKQFIKKKINQANKNLSNKKQPSNLIQALLIQKNKNKQQKSTQDALKTQQQILQQFTGFFLAGTQTASHLLLMMIYYTALDKNIQTKVREQIQKYMKNNDFSYENIKNLKYLQMIQKQTTRIYGPGTDLFTRIATKDNYLNGVAIRKGTKIFFPTISNHYSQKYFKQPYKFRPQRWESECDNLPLYVFGGFSAGARGCIGKHLALLQTKIAFVKFMKRYKQIILPTKQFKMSYKFVYHPQKFDTKLILNEEQINVEMK